MSYSSDLDEMIAAVEEDFAQVESASAEVSNSAEYARPLAELEGYWIFNPGHFRRSVARELEEIETLRPEALREALQKAAQGEAEWLAATPPPGGWTPDTGNLQDSYDADAQVE